jgi:hypothetical protein
MEAIPLADGDLRWVFPELADESRVRDVLRQAAARVEELADHLGVRPSWTGSGLEFIRLPGQEAATLFGCAETTDVSLVAELSKASGEWVVDAEISVRCDGAADCGTHGIETRPGSAHATAVDAANGLLTATTWLLHRGIEEPPGSWRRRDTRSGHR